MNMFWDLLVKPLLSELKLKNIVEVGAQTGINTNKILQYCREQEGKLHTIDPAPIFDYMKLKEENEENFEFYKELSLSALPLLKDYDAILLDGDHNWYTVYHELNCINDSFKGKEKFPLILLHDIGWPYGRRDLYYNPENIPDVDRNSTRLNYSHSI